MLSKRALVITNQYLEACRKWNSILKLGENVCVIFPYLSDRQSRVFQWSESLDKNAFYPIFMDFSTHHFDEINELENYIISLLPESCRSNDLSTSLKKIDKTIILITVDGETSFDTHNYRTLHFLQSILTNYQEYLLSFISFESNIYSNSPTMHYYNKLFQNILYYPLYSDKDIDFFLQYLCKKWQMKMSSSIRKAIVSACGGSIWLAKEAGRNYRDQGAWNNNSQGFQDRLNLLAKMFSEKEAVILNSLPLVKTHIALDEYKYLKNTGFITEKFQPRIYLLRPILKEKMESGELLKIKEEEIFLKGVPITHALSPTEFSILRLFLSEPSTPISRDRIASAIWPNNTEDHYSAWAIDQAIKRLRDRLVSLRLPPTIISSVRGVGYEYRS